MESKKLVEMIDTLKGLVFYNRRYGDFFVIKEILKKEYTITHTERFINYSEVKGKRDKEVAIYVLRRVFDGRYDINQSTPPFSYYYQTKSNSYYSSRRERIMIEVKTASNESSIRIKPKGMRLVLPIRTINKSIEYNNIYLKVGKLIGQIIELYEQKFFRIIKPEPFLNVYMPIGEADGDEGIHYNAYEIIKTKKKKGSFYPCVSCGRYINLGEKELCPNCKEKFERCKICGEIRDINFIHWRMQVVGISHLDKNNPNRVYTKPTRVCNNCLRKKTFKCDICHDRFVTEDKNSMGGRYSDPAGRVFWLCKKCEREASFFNCDACRESYLTIYMRNYNGQRLCTRCYDRIMRERRNFLHSFDYIPLKYTKKKKKWDDKLLMGFELEVMTKIPKEKREIDYLREKAAEITDWLEKNKLDKYFFIKNDGSLREEGRRSGFEVNSHPFSLNAKRFLKIKEMLTFLKNKGFVSYEAKPCGFHVHLSAIFFSSNPNKDMSVSELVKDQTFRDNVCKLLSFFSVNASKIYAFSKRKIRDYCQPISFDEWTFYTTSDSPEGFERFRNGINRYSIINIKNLYEGSKKKTIEIRSFKGTLDHKRFIATLQFCDAIAHFIKQVSIISMIKNSKNSWKEFTHWIKDTNSYGHLAKYLESENLI